MKNKIFIGVAVMALVLPIGTYAEVLSSQNYSPYEMYDKCYEPYQNSGLLENPEIVDACMDCFFLGEDGIIHTNKFRVHDEITFDTKNQTCTVNEESRFKYYYTYQDCYDDAASEVECWQCMYGANREIAHIDEGADQTNGIAFVYDSGGDDDRCEIYDSSLISCAAGWYGFPYDDEEIRLYGCTKCPGNGASDAVAGRRKNITDCYIPKDTDYKDLSGTYHYTDDCHYTN